jgi:hypothetical protein
MKRSALWAGNPCVGLLVSCLVGLQTMRMPQNQALHLTAAACRNTFHLCAGSGWHERHAVSRRELQRMD